MTALTSRDRGPTPGRVVNYPSLTLRLSITSFTSKPAEVTNVTFRTKLILRRDQVVASVAEVRAI